MLDHAFLIIAVTDIIRLNINVTSHVVPPYVSLIPEVIENGLSFSIHTSASILQTEPYIQTGSA